MSRWFRVYDDLVDDPKVQRLSAENFRALINLWCLASKGEGLLPPLEDIAFKLRVSEDKATRLLADLSKAGLLVNDETGTSPHKWGARQFKSDVSNERVKRHRERQRNVTSPVTVTPPDTEADTEAERVVSETNVSGAAAPAEIVPVDARTALFRDGVSAVRTMTGKGDGPVRAIVGKWLKEARDDCQVVLEIILAAADMRPADPVGWITKSLQARKPQVDPAILDKNGNAPGDPYYGVDY